MTSLEEDAVANPDSEKPGGIILWSKPIIHCNINLLLYHITYRSILLIINKIQKYLRYNESSSR